MKLRHTSLILLILISGLLAQQIDSTVKNYADNLANNVRRLERNDATGVASHITLENPLEHEGDIESHAERFFKEYPVFGVREFKNELKMVNMQKDPHFANRFTALFEQRHKGLKVFGSQLRLHFNENNHITGADGAFIADLINFNTEPLIQKEEAIEIAKKYFSDKYNGSNMVVEDAELVIYRDGLFAARKGDNHVAWMCIISDQQLRRDRIFVDAKSGDVIVVIPLVHTIRREAWQGAYLVGEPFWVEGDVFPTNSSDANVNLNASLAVYTAFQNAFNYTSYDDKDSTMIMVFDLQDNTTGVCPNAFWNGTVLASCPGVNAFDVAAHEWGHAYDQYSADLIYLDQSGAINEGFADIVGETIQLLFNTSYPVRNQTCNSGSRWIVGEDLLVFTSNSTSNTTTNIGIRDMYNPNCFLDPRSVNDTQYIQCGTADNGGVHTNAGIVDQLYSLSVDGGTLNNITVSGLGLTKCFHIFLRTLLVKLQPSSNFKDLATALGASCNDLIGLNLTDPVTGNITSGTNNTISATDCLSIQDAINATQLNSPFCVNGTNTTGQAPEIFVAFPPVGETGNVNTTVYFLSAPVVVNNTQNATCLITQGNTTFTTRAKLTTNDFFFLFSCPVITSNTTNTTLFITVSADGINYSSTGLTFNFTTPINVTSVSPTTGAAQGGTVVTVFGNNFELFTGCQPFPATDINGDSYDCLTCIFGNVATENPVRATFINSTAVSCVAPSYFNLIKPTRTVSVWVSKNAQEFHTSNAANFTYNVTISSSSPSNIPNSASRSRTRTAIPISRSITRSPFSHTPTRTHVVSPSKIPRSHSTTPSRTSHPRTHSNTRTRTPNRNNSSILSPSFIFVTLAVLISIFLF